MTGVQTCALPICFPVTIGKKIKSLAKPIDTPIKADTKEAEGKIKKLSGPIDVKINSGQVQAAVASMQADIQNSFVGGQGGPGGVGGQGGQGGPGGDATNNMGTVEGLLGDLKTIMTTLTSKLPVPAIV